MKLGGWGRYPLRETRLLVPRDEEELAAILRREECLIARGVGRAYGDAAISPGVTLGLQRFNRMCAFDADTGRLVAEAGVTLEEILDTFLPRGWFPTVTPGTKYVTLGGMIAADVHGKNHHRDGSFASCVDWIEVMETDGTVQRLSRTQHPERFAWTLGGMGLTGLVLRAAIRLRPIETAWIRQTTIPAPNLEAAMQAFEEYDAATYSVAWIDCLGQGERLGRSLVMLGEHARRDELPPDRASRPLCAPLRPKRHVPFDLPSSLLNRHSVAAFNALYYALGERSRGERLVDWDRYFYPLDAILGWNRIYGRRGFVQFQCALPHEHARDGLTALLQATARAGAGSFLAVLKRFGATPGGTFSFPLPGYTLALDFPVTPDTLELLETLDRITLEHGGRFYLAKDARLTAKTLHAADERAATLRAFRQDARLTRFTSYLSRRLSL